MKTGSDRDKSARRRRAAVVLAPFLLVVVLPLACSEDATLVGPGGECFAATDCQPGLVCVPQRGGSRLCTNDLTQVVGRPPPDGAAAGEAGEAGEGGPVEAGETDGPVQDTSMPDSSVPDTSMPVDAADAG